MNFENFYKQGKIERHAVWAGETKDGQILVSESIGVLKDYCIADTIISSVFICPENKKFAYPYSIVGSYESAEYATSVDLLDKSIDKSTALPAILMDAYPEKVFPQLCYVELGLTRGNLLPNRFGLFNRSFVARVNGATEDGFYLVKLLGASLQSTSSQERGIVIPESDRDAVAMLGIYLSSVGIIGDDKSSDYSIYRLSTPSGDVLLGKEAGAENIWYVFVGHAWNMIDSEDVKNLGSAKLLVPSIYQFMFGDNRIKIKRSIGQLNLFG